MASLCASVWLMMVNLLYLTDTLGETDPKSLPMWKREFDRFRWWKGQYRFNKQTHSCNFVIHSVQFDDSKGAIGTFSSENTNLDMTVTSLNDIRIFFKQEVMYKGSEHFYDDFEFVMEMLPQGKVYVMQGNITKPASNFSTIYFQPEGTTSTNYQQSSNISVGLAIGISLFLFVVCTVAGIVIMRWAIKKGYLRHVAMSYKFFRNPDTPVSFDNSDDGRRSEDVQVHI